MDAKPAQRRASTSRRLSDRLHGRRPAPRRFGRAPSAPGGPPAKPGRLGQAARFLAAVLLPFGVALVQAEYYPHFTWALFYPAAYFSSLLGGTAAGLVATAVSAFLGLFFFTPPEESWPEHGYYAFVPAALFMLMGTIFSISHGRLKKVTRAWQSATKELDEVFENAPVGIFISDLDGRYTDVNGAACRLLGRAREELLGRTIGDLLHPGQEGRLAEDREFMLRTGEPRAGEWELQRGDGSFVPVEVSASILPDGRWQAFVRDLSERRRAEEAQRRLAEAQRRDELRIALESAANAMVMIDERGLIVLSNVEADKLFGYAPGELTGRVLEVLVPERFRARHPALRDAFFREAGGKRAMAVGRTLVALRKDGREFPVEIVLTRVALVGEKFVVTSVVDLTEVKKTEEDLRRTVQDLQGFAYTVSHDLRSPLRAIQGYAHFAQDRLKEKADAESLEMLQRISSSAIHLDHLIRDVLSYSAITRQEVVLSPVDLDKVVSHVVGLYPVLQSARLDVKRPLGSVLAQESLMLQIVSNLLVNAVKFVPAGREASIEVRTESGGSGKLNLIVEDNGPGIPRVHWERIFQPFARLPSSRGVAGSGIGLAIVKRAVERLGGAIRVESDPCTGTRFIIELAEAGHDR